MALTKDQKAELDDQILAALTREEWEAADVISNRVPMRRVDAYMVGARLRSLKSRGLVESRDEGYFSKWRLAG